MQLADIKEDTVLVVDGGFSCLTEGEFVVASRDDIGLYVPCDDGKHYLAGQTDHHGDLVGLRLTTALPVTTALPPVLGIDLVLSAIGHLGAALIQSVPEDNGIIIGHIRSAHALLTTLTKATRAETQAAPSTSETRPARNVRAAR